MGGRGHDAWEPYSRFWADNDLRKNTHGHERLAKGVASDQGGKAAVFSSSLAGRNSRAGVVFVTEEKETRGMTIAPSTGQRVAVEP